MKIKRITALLLSALCLTAVPQIPAVKDLGTNYTITAEAAAGVVGYVTTGKIRYNIQRDSSNNLYAIAAKADSSITNATIPAYVTYDKKSVPVKRIGGSAFANVKNLTKLDMTYATNLTEIGEKAFATSTIDTVYIGSNRISNGSIILGENAFFCSTVKTIKFYGNKITINSNAFAGSRLTTVQFDSSVKTAVFKTKAFANTNALNTLSFDSQSTSLTLGSYSFVNSYMIRCNLPATVKTIPEGCFNNCISLDTFSIPSSVTNIGDYAFGGARLPASFKIGKNVTKISTNAFSGICNTVVINVDSANTKFKSDNGVLCSKDGQTIYCYPPKRPAASYTSSAKYISEYSFPNNEYLTELNLPNYAGNPSKYLGNLNNLEKLTVSSSLYDRYWDDDFMVYFGSLFSSTNLHCVNGQEMIVISHNSEPYFCAKISTAIENDPEKYMNYRLIERYNDMMGDYVVNKYTDSTMNDLMKAVRIHQWILDRVTYDPAVIKNKNDDNLLNHEVFGLFFRVNENGERCITCEGYARGYEFLMKKAGVETKSFTLWDSGHKNGHAWNIVKIDGSYYFTDVCWDDSVYDAYNHSKDSDYYKYFMKSYKSFEDDNDENIEGSGHIVYMGNAKSYESNYSLYRDLSSRYKAFLNTIKSYEY